MNILDTGLILSMKLLSWALRTTGLGAGGTWPGEILLRLRPGILRRLSDKTAGIVLVAGTNGKTTTSKMIKTILDHHGFAARHNDTGANLDNGLVSSFISGTTWYGVTPKDYMIFEVDEATLPRVLPSFTPRIVVLMNLFRDQLDRYGEVDTVAQNWLSCLVELPEEVTYIINADDPHLSYIGSKLRGDVRYFGLSDNRYIRDEMQHATDAIYCPSCGNRLTFGGVYFSHLGKWTCGKCKFTHPEMDLVASDITSPLEGTYNIYNTLASALVAKELGIEDSQIQGALDTFTPAFGRFETIEYAGTSVTIVLSKNPTGFNESLATMLKHPDSGSVLLVLNDRVPDGRDVSWIWDVDFEELVGLQSPIHVAGDRCYDMAVRLKYAGIKQENINVHTDLSEAIHTCIDDAQKDMMWVMATYSAMLEVREILVGKKIH